MPQARESARDTRVASLPKCTPCNFAIVLAATVFVAMIWAPAPTSAQSRFPYVTSFSGWGIGVGQSRFSYTGLSEYADRVSTKTGIVGYLRVGRQLAPGLFLTGDVRGWYAQAQDGNWSTSLEFSRIGVVGSIMYVPSAARGLSFRAGWGLASVHNEYLYCTSLLSESLKGRCLYVLGDAALGSVTEFALGYDIRLSRHLRLAPAIEVAVYRYRDRYDVLTQLMLGSAHF